MPKKIKYIAIILILVCAGPVPGQTNRLTDSLITRDDWLVIEDIRISGNDITRERVILRELLFSKGDTILKMELLPAIQRSRENLLNLSLFNFVYFDADHFTGNRIQILISLTERWYVWPVPIIEYADRNFSTFIQNRDWEKINYGLWLKWNNFRGSNELLTGKFRLGYINEYALAYQIPNLGRKQQHGISMGFNLNDQNEIFIATVNNYPVEYTPEEKPALRRLNAFSHYTFRRKIYTTHSLRLDYYQYITSDSVAENNPNFLGENRSRLGFFSFSYYFNHDMRDSRIYPLEGFAVKLRAEKLGLGIIPGNNYNNLLVTGVFLFHQQLANRIYFYNATKARYSFEKLIPYAFNRGLGYNEFLSGYEPYVIDGSDYFITKYNLKFQVIKPTTRTLPLIRMKQFEKIHYAIYFNLFADAGYVYNIFPDPTNTMVNNWQVSAGAGLDLVTYYDQVFRIDYSMNRFGDHGFFFHLEVPFFRW
ncbi:MAG: hypothetical protein EHM46_06060 [Bacteroidetes bacterium]|nr:MAG: hypothetical protein EHM46_06060 [Bacteroidota bacterium]